MTAVLSNDIRSDSFKAVLAKFKQFKYEEGSHWTFAGDTSSLQLNASMQTTIQQISQLQRKLRLEFALLAAKIL